MSEKKKFKDYKEISLDIGQICNGEKFEEVMTALEFVIVGMLIKDLVKFNADIADVFFERGLNFFIENVKEVYQATREDMIKNEKG
jgi:hypothetical protein